jgi:hypothetical protein
MLHLLLALNICNVLSSYTLPYLFQSLDTANVANPNYKLSVCDSELTSALKYTDIAGTQGTHPDFPPFPICRSKIPAPAVSTQSGTPGSPAPMNPASATQGYLVVEGGEAKPAEWVTKDWVATITVPNTLVKTASSGTL